MKDKKDVLPIILASAVALIVTAVVKFLIPSGNSNMPNPKPNEIQMPNIPLMIKETEKLEEVFVLTTSKKIAKGTKISLDYLTWKKWPKEIIEQKFIVKNENGDALNNASDYQSSLKMWSANVITSGVPLTLDLLTNVDPVKQAEEDRKKAALEEESKAAVAIKKEMEEFLKNGHRAITFNVDQKSACTSDMFSPGDRVDVLIMEQKGEKTKIHKYKALKIIAIDGIWKKVQPKKEEKEEKGGIAGGFLGSTMSSINAAAGLTTPKNVTLEIKEEFVEIMLKQSATSGGVVLSVRSQAEAVKEGEIYDSDDGGNAKADAVLDGIINMNTVSASEALIAEQNKKNTEEKNMAALISNMNSISDASYEQAKTNRKGGVSSFEFVSGKTIGSEDEVAVSEKKVVIYKKMNAKSVSFDEQGNKVEEGGGGATVASSAFNGNQPPLDRKN